MTVGLSDWVPTVRTRDHFCLGHPRVCSGQRSTWSVVATGCLLCVEVQNKNPRSSFWVVLAVHGSAKLESTLLFLGRAGLREAKPPQAGSWCPLLYQGIDLGSAGNIPCLSVGPKPLPLSWGRTKNVTPC